MESSAVVYEIAVSNLGSSTGTYLELYVVLLLGYQVNDTGIILSKSHGRRILANICNSLCRPVAIL
jgi:hypothetical protein